MLVFPSCNLFQYRVCNWFILADEPKQRCKPAGKQPRGKKKKSSGQLCCRIGTNVGRKEGQECVVSGSSTDFECKTASSVKRVSMSKTAKQVITQNKQRKRELGAWNIL